MTGLEPAHRKTPDPKSGASTNFATRAGLWLSVECFFLNHRPPMLYFFTCDCKGNNNLGIKKTLRLFFCTSSVKLLSKPTVKAVGTVAAQFFTLHFSLFTFHFSLFTKIRKANSHSSFFIFHSSFRTPSLGNFPPLLGKNLCQE